MLQWHTLPGVAALVDSTLQHRYLIVRSMSRFKEIFSIVTRTYHTYYGTWSLSYVAIAEQGLKSVKVLGRRGLVSFWNEMSTVRSVVFVFSWLWDYAAKKVLSGTRQIAGDDDSYNFNE